MADKSQALGTKNDRLSIAMHRRPFIGRQDELEALQAKQCLIAMGYLCASSLENEGEEAQQQLQDALTHFQKAHGLVPSGTLQGQDLELLINRAELAKSVQCDYKS